MHYLSKNLNAIYVLQQHLDKVDWYELSKNKNVNYILHNNLDNLSKLEWNESSLNT